MKTTRKAKAELPKYTKKDFPVSDIRRYLEPGPTVVVSSEWKDQKNIMTMGWYTILEFQPSLIGCMVTSTNHSFDMIRKSKECVINLPTIDLLDQVVKIGNSTGADTDKFEEFGLTPVDGTKVEAPLIKEAFANFECKVVDARMLVDYNFFILECVKAHVATSPKYPTTVHYRGEGIFMVSGEHVNRKKMFRKENL